MEQHLKTLAEALNIANKAGAYQLQDSAVIFQALQHLVAHVKDIENKENEHARELKAYETTVDNLNKRIESLGCLSKDSCEECEIETLPKIGKK